MVERDRLYDLLRQAPETPIAVVGDIIADRYISCSSGRVSREAPVMILSYQDEKILAGGAANAAVNLRAVGAPVILLGIVGDDEHGRTVLEILEREGVDVESVIVDKGRGTTVKTRVLAGDIHSSNQQVLRIDRDQPDRLGASLEARMGEVLGNLVSRVKGLLLSDYGQGSLSGEARTRAISLGRERRLVVCADSRRRLDAFRGVTTATPNITEALPAVPAELREDLDRAGRYLLDSLQAESLIVTLGKSGMRVFTRGGPPLTVGVVGGVDVVDVTGAGDTVSSVVTIALAAGGTPIESAILASHAAGVVVTRKGTAAASRAELEQSLRERWESS